MLSRAAIGVSHEAQAEGGWTIDLPSGSRDVTTFSKLPNATPGTNAIAASPAPTSSSRRRSSRDTRVRTTASPDAARVGPLPRRVPQHDVVRQLVPLDGVAGRQVDRQVGAQPPAAEREHTVV